MKPSGIVICDFLYTGYRLCVDKWCGLIVYNVGFWPIIPDHQAGEAEASSGSVYTAEPSIASSCHWRCWSCHSKCFLQSLLFISLLCFFICMWSYIGLTECPSGAFVQGTVLVIILLALSCKHDTVSRHSQI